MYTVLILYTEVCITTVLTRSTAHKNILNNLKALAPSETKVIKALVYLCRRKSESAGDYKYIYIYKIKC